MDQRSARRAQEPFAATSEVDPWASGQRDIAKILIVLGGQAVSRAARCIHPAVRFLVLLDYKFAASLSAPNPLQTASSPPSRTPSTTSSPVRTACCGRIDQRRAQRLIAIAHPDHRDELAVRRIKTSHCIDKGHIREEDPP